MDQSTTAQSNATAFIERWSASGAAERANYQLFLTELCDVIGVERPQPATERPDEDRYVFEKGVPSGHGTTERIDLYKRDCFVLEAKQGSDEAQNGEGALSEAALKRQQRRRRGTAVRGTAGWDTAMERARNQAQRYARNLPPPEVANGRPPFLITVDVGNTIALYSEFTRSGGNYVPFPDPHSYRLTLHDLQDPNVRALLRAVWTDPTSLDPAQRSARVTREIADRLARLARSLEQEHEPELVAQFLMRCLFTMFAEDVALLPERSFMQLLADIRQDPSSFRQMIEHLWRTMDRGGFSVILRQELPRFNGSLFANPEALPLNEDQIQLLVEAAQADWRDVEPAIFGTLLERALDPVERHKLGAHYTPRAYVERLVQPTVIEPLRAEWESVQAAALLHAEEGQTEKAIAEVAAFQKQLASTRILDSACGSGNFLYVTLELMKRLEGEVLNTLAELGAGQMRLEIEGVMVTPQQFLGIEVNPRAAAIAELVLWIGFLQWHLRTRGEVRPPEPIIRNYHNIECRDAVLAWDHVEVMSDEQGRPVMRWDGRTMKRHPVTGELVPDEKAQLPVYRYINPRPAEWPEADYVVGNPPFIGNKQMREALGDGYTEALRKSYAKVPESADYVMYWWDKAARLTRTGKIRRFGLITTNSLRQIFNRRVLTSHMEAKNPISLVYAVPDHPWVDSADGANVRISMTVGTLGEEIGLLNEVISEEPDESGEIKVLVRTALGKIQTNLTVGPNVAEAAQLKANEGLSRQGCKLVGSHFQIKPAKHKWFIEINPSYADRLPQYIAGRDITQKLTLRYVIDLFGLDEVEARQRYPELMQHLVDYVLPVRRQTKRRAMRENWWIFGEARRNLREALAGLSRYIVTSEVSKHRFFTFVPWPEVLIDGSIIAIASEDAYVLGVLSSKPHIIWALAAGGTLEDRPRYNNSKCFGTFPFPNPTAPQKARIRDLAEQLDAHRKRQQAQHPDLTMTDMYNVLEKVRGGEALNDRERETHEKGLIAILLQLHQELDHAVGDAYGWPHHLQDEEILQRLVDLNAERAAEEANGLIRWLRPEYQAPEELKAQQATLLQVTGEGDARPEPTEKQPWPRTLKEQAQSVRNTLAAFAGPANVEEVAATFKGRRTKKRLDQIEEILEMLVALGQAQLAEGERYVAG